MTGTTQERVTAIRRALMQMVRPSFRMPDPHNTATVRAIDLIDDVFNVNEHGIVDGPEE